MKILCISASNSANMGENSTSTQVCNLIKRIVALKSPEIDVEILQLMSQKINFCMLCGDCYEDSKCPYDQTFNYLYSKLKKCDAFFWVVPHYTPLPSKLLALFEKMNEILYCDLIKIPHFVSPFEDKPTAIIAHGDMVESNDTLKYYHDTVVRPVANTLTAFGFDVISYNDEYPQGIAFGIKDETCLRSGDSSVFPEVIHQWDIIEKRIYPLVSTTISSISSLSA